MTGQADSYAIRDAHPDDLPILPTIERAAALALTTFSDVPRNDPYYGCLGFLPLM